MGPELTFLCNNAYRRNALGNRYPWALGKPASDVWAEVWGDVGPLVEQTMGTGTATWGQGMLLFLERYGYSGNPIDLNRPIRPMAKAWLSWVPVTRSGNPSRSQLDADARPNRSNSLGDGVLPGALTTPPHHQEVPFTDLEPARRSAGLRAQ